MMHAIQINNTKLVQYLCDNASNGLLKQHTDAGGSTAAHYVVNPLAYGSWENSQILDILATSGYPLTARDASGKTPLDYAICQSSGKLANALRQHEGKNTQTTQSVVTYTPSN